MTVKKIEVSVEENIIIMFIVHSGDIESDNMDGYFKSYDDAKEYVDGYIEKQIEDCYCDKFYQFLDGHTIILTNGQHTESWSWSNDDLWINIQKLVL